MADETENKQTQEQHQEQLQQKYMQFQMIQQQLEKISQQLETLTTKLSELEVSKEALAELKKTKLDTEILANVAPGIFVKAALKDNQKLLVNVGADVTVEKTIDQVVEMLDQQKKDLTEAVAQHEALMQEFSQQAMKLYQEIEAS